MRVFKKQASRIILFAVLTLSAVLLVKATVDYVEFYIALKDFQMQVVSFDVAVNSDSFDVAINFRVLNPTPYGGLRLQSIVNTISYEGENHTVIISPGHTLFGGSPFQQIETRWWELPQFERSIDQDVTPYSTINISPINRTVTSADAQRFINYLERQGQYQENIQWRLTSIAYLQTPTFMNTLGLQFEFSLEWKIT